MNPKTSYQTIRAIRRARLAFSFAFAIATSSLLGCRSTLPPEQPSRLWEVFGRQTGRFFPKSEPTVATMHPSQSGTNSSAVDSTSSLPARPQTSPGLQTARGVPVTPNGLMPPHQASSAMMIPPLPREVR